MNMNIPVIVFLNCGVCSSMYVLTYHCRFCRYSVCDVFLHTYDLRKKLKLKKNLPYILYIEQRLASHTTRPSIINYNIIEVSFALLLFHLTSCTQRL